MWLKFPKGVTEVSALQTNFQPEAVVKGKTVANNQNFFRAPLHIAQHILGLGIGFTVEEPPEGSHDLGELADQDEAAADATRQFAEQVRNLQEELRAANETIGTLTAENTALTESVEDLTNERDTYQKAGAEAAVALAALHDQIVDRNVNFDDPNGRWVSVDQAATEKKD